MTQQRPPAPPPRPSASARPPASRALAKWLPLLVIGVAMLGSAAFILYVILRVEDEQIPLMAAGFVVLGASFAAAAIWSVVGMWKAASRARGGRAFGLAILGGLAGMAAIGCFTVTALSMLVWNT